MSSHESGAGSPVTSWPVERLRLDPDNPRLAETLPNATQTELLREFLPVLRSASLDAVHVAARLLQ